LRDRIITNGLVSIENGRISSLHDDARTVADFSFSDSFIVPGFISIHEHGIASGDSKTSDGMIKMAEFAPSVGTTSFCPTLASCTFHGHIEHLEAVKCLSEKRGNASAKIAGSHLEGPYINPLRKGGMAENLLRMPNKEEIKKLFEAAGGTLRIMTLSPEVEGVEWLIPLLKENGCTVSAGHTICPTERFKEMVNLGITNICHIFDTFDGREVRGGITQSSLPDEIMIDDRLFIEVILDGIHVPPTLVKLTRKAIGADRFVGITDSMEGTGFPDGKYTMPDGRIYIIKNGDVARLENGDISGSTLTMARAFSNLINKFGFTAVEASKALSLNPAEVIGIDKDTGELRKGLCADITVIDKNGNVKATWVAGIKVFQCTKKK
jgi:N-acetylglucosamine-6-phosphate deacetylase